MRFFWSIILLLQLNPLLAQFTGGIDDGYSLDQHVNTMSIYSGGSEDGYHHVELKNLTSIFRGDTMDGYARGDFINNLSIYKGGNEDGYGQGYLISLSVGCPSDQILEACSDENSIQLAYNDWVNGFSVNDGCSGVTSNIGNIPSLPSFTLGAAIDLDFILSAIDICQPSPITCSSTFTVEGATGGNCLDCTVYDTAPIDLTKSFDPVNGVQDRVQLKWFKAVPEVRYTDEDAAACDVKFWPKRNLIPGTTTPTGPVIVAGPTDTVNIVNAKKFYGDGVTPREIFKWPVKFRKASDAPSAKRADPNIRYEWKVRCACEHGAGQESPWSVVKIFNVLDFDPVTGIYTPPPGQEDLSLTKSLADEAMEIQLYPNPNDGTFRIRLETEEKIADVQLTLRDIQGKQIEQQAHSLVKGSQEIIWESQIDLEKGIYLMEISTDKHRYTKRVIIDR